MAMYHSEADQEALVVSGEDVLIVETRALLCSSRRRQQQCRMRLIVYPASVLFVLGGIAITVVLTGRRPAAQPRTKDRDYTARLDLALFVSVAAVIAVTLVPTHGGRDLQLVPLKDIIAAFTPPLQRSQMLGAAGNVFLFAPLGAVLSLRGLPLNRAVLAGMAFSAGIEVTQLLVAGRTTSFDDVLLNTLGIVIGHSVVAPSTFRNVRQRRSQSSGRRGARKTP